MIQLKPLRQYYCTRFEWSDNLFDAIDWDIFRPVYKKLISSIGIQWLHKYCIKRLPTGERINKRDHFHDKRCASCWHSVEDDDHMFRCVKRKGQRKNIFKQLNILRNNRVDTIMRHIAGRLINLFQWGMHDEYNVKNMREKRHGELQSTNRRTTYNLMGQPTERKILKAMENTTKSIYKQDTIKRSSNARKKTKKQETKREDI
jgi:hypothetical protein